MHDVRPGDIAHTRRAFTAADFAAFADATGDRNPVHHDADHAVEAGFDGPIVPLAMTLGPVSALIGMVLPGPGAVILDTAFRPVRAVAFDRPVTYSLRAVSVSAATGVLTCRLLAFQDRRTVLEGTVRSTLRAPRPRPDDPAAGELLPAGARRTAVVTGAAGDIGAAVARKLAADGWDLALVHRGGAEEVARQCEEAGATVHLVTADLAVAAERSAAGQRLAALAPVALVHAAAPPLAAGLGAHVEVGYAALRDLADRVVDGMLLRQRGCFVLLGSLASRLHPPGWSDYVAAKSAAASLLRGVDHHHGASGVRAVLVEPGYVEGRYSAGVRPAGTLGLLPEEVADVVAAELADAEGPSRRVELTPEGVVRFGLTGDGTVAPDDVPAVRPAPAQAAVAAPSSGLPERVEAVVRGVLGPQARVRGGGVGLTAGWDSLGQIQIVLAVEKEFGIVLPAASLAGAGRFEQLCAAVAERAGG